MAIIVQIIITIAFMFFLFPAVMWIYIALKRTTGEVSYLAKKIHKYSWYFSMPIGIVLAILGILLLFI